MEKAAEYDELPDVVVLSIIQGGKIFPKEVPYVSRHILTYTGNNQCYMKGQSYVFVELDKFKKELSDLLPNDIQDRWCYFLKNHLKEVDSIPLQLLEIPEIGQAYQILDECHWSPEEMGAYNRSRMKVMDDSGCLAFAVDQGKAEGKAEGMREVAKNMKSLGIDIQTIVKATGLSEAEIDKL